MLFPLLTAVFAVLIVTNGEPNPNTKDGGPIAELPENWDQTKDDTQSLFLNKSDKNDLEPYPLALSEEGNPEAFEQTGALDNLIMRPELYGEPPAMEGLSAGYESSRRKRGSGKVGAGAATKVATKSGSGKKNLKPDETPMPIDSAIYEHENNRRKRGSGTKVNGAAASAKSISKTSGGNKKNLRPDETPMPIDSAIHEHDNNRKKRGSGTKVNGAAAPAESISQNFGGTKKNLRPISERRKRDSGLSAADVRALLNFWEAQERRKQEWNPNQRPDYYGRVNALDEEPEDDNEVWYNEPVLLDPTERDYPHRSYFSEQNRIPIPLNDMYPDPNELLQRYEEAQRKRMYVNKMKRFMVARKRSDGHQSNYRSRDDLYTLAELLRSGPRVQEQDIPLYRRLIL